jgi:hypothetical protein
MVYRVKPKTVLKLGMLPDLSLKTRGPIVYTIVEDRGETFKISGFSKDGAYVTDFYREPTQKFLKELQKSTTLILRLPKKEIRKEEDFTKQLQKQFGNLHQQLSNRLKIKISYPYTLLIDLNLHYENSRIFGSKLVDGKIYIPPDLESKGIFELFVIIELFSEYLKSKILFTKSPKEPILRELALLLSSTYFKFEKNALILKIIEAPIILEEDCNFTRKLKKILTVVPKKSFTQQECNKSLESYIQFIQFFDTYRIKLTFKEFYNLFYQSCVILSPNNDIELKKDIYLLYSAIFYDVHTTKQSEKSMLLNLLFSLHTSESPDFTTLVSLLRVISKSQSMGKEILKLEELISVFISDYLTSKALRFEMDYVISERVLNAKVKIENSIDYTFHNFSNEISWRPVNRVALQEYKQKETEIELRDIWEGEYLFKINSKGNVQILTKISFTNPVFPSRKMEKTIILDKLKI